MNKIKIVLGIFLVLLLFLNLSQAKTPVKEIDKTKNVPVLPQQDKTKAPDQEKSPTKKAGNYILVTDVLDGFGGQRYNGGCDLSIFAGGQSSAIGSGSSANYNLYAGFVYPTQVSCGDLNADGITDIGDIVFCINYVFYGGPAPDPLESGDVNCDEIVDIGDIVYLINYVFYGGAEPVCP